MQIKLGAARLTLPARPAIPRLACLPHPADGRRQPDPELRCSLTRGQPPKRRINYPITQILAVSPCHASSPDSPIIGGLALFARFGNPPESENHELALDG